MSTAVYIPSQHMCDNYILSSAHNYTLNRGGWKKVDMYCSLKRKMVGMATLLPHFHETAWNKIYQWYKDA